MIKGHISALVTVALNKCSTAVSKAFKLIFHQIQNKSHFDCSFKQFWIRKNSKPILEKIENINCKAKTKVVSTFDFFHTYTEFPHLI